MDEALEYKFIDLFAGIGGFHLGMSNAGMKCVFASEIDKNARETYIKNHLIEESIFNDDIRKISPDHIPDHDILCAGFPCQPFSQAGNKKGFDDGSNSERGNLFFCIADILEEKRPKSFILENVRHLLKHDEGNTFKVIQQTLEEIGYAVYYKVIKACEFGRPQLRPRVYIIGFDKEQVSSEIPYEFPTPIPLKMTMSDVWEGDCSREIGFTLRVGGRGSSINDRRNWDSYLVDGQVKQLTPLQGKRMMGLPDDFILPKTMTHSMKQLGNSVCVDVIENLAKSVQTYIKKHDYKGSRNKDILMAKNKGEWSELYAFFKLLIDNKLHFGDEFAENLNEFVTVVEIAHNNTDLVYKILESEIVFSDRSGTEKKRIKTADFITADDVTELFEKIKSAQGSSFEIPEINGILDTAFISTSVKGGTFEKGDIQIAFDYNKLTHPIAPVGIKSDLGAKPTLLNASSATNFIFEINGLNCGIDEINSVDTKSKVKDRLRKIIDTGANVNYHSCELAVHQENLEKVDSLMPSIIAEALLAYYLGEGSKFSDLVVGDQKQIRVKEYLKAVLLGMFSSKTWDGNYESNGSILVRKDGELTLFHVVKDSCLKNYLFAHTKFDTPSTTRHRFGAVYKEGEKYFIKLNLQIRML